jgi:hypothetical protein
MERLNSDPAANEAIKIPAHECRYAIIARTVSPGLILRESDHVSICGGDYHSFSNVPWLEQAAGLCIKCIRTSQAISL